MRKFIAFAILFMGIGVAVFLSGFTMPTALSLTVFVLAIISDSFTTWLCLRKRGQEGNPVAAFLFKKVGFGGTCIFMAGIWVAIITFRFLPAIDNAQTAIACAYWLVPLNNLLVLRRLTRATAATG